MSTIDSQNAVIHLQEAYLCECMCARSLSLSLSLSLFACYSDDGTVFKVSSFSSIKFILSFLSLMGLFS